MTGARKYMVCTAPIMLVGGLFLFDGYVHGLWANRWQNNEDVAKACSNLELLPLTIGDWQGSALKPLSERLVQQAGFAGYLNRSYKNGPTGAVVTILVACGRPGPLAVHTPEVCYRGSGYEATGVSVKVEEKVPGIKAEVWQADFRKPGLSSTQALRVLWTWSSSGEWKASDNPRLEFAGASVLHKLYVVSEVITDDAEARKTCSEFVSQLFPELNKYLFKTH